MKTTPTKRPKLHGNTRAALQRLPRNPAKPMKGRGYERRPFDHDLRGLAKEIWNAIPERHRCEVLYRRKGGWFGSSLAISPEAEKAIKTPLKRLREEQQALHEDWAKKEAQKPENLPRRASGGGIPVKINRDNLALSSLTPEEVEEFASLVEGRLHPIEGRALALKTASGLTWGQIQGT